MALLDEPQPITGYQKKRLTWARYQNHGKINTSKINSSPPHVDSGTYASYWRTPPVVYLDLRGNAFALKYLPYMPLPQVGQFRHIFSTQIVSFNRKDCKDVHALWRGDLPMPTWDFAGHKFRFATLKKTREGAMLGGNEIDLQEKVKGFVNLRKRQRHRHYVVLILTL